MTASAEEDVFNASFIKKIILTHTGASQDSRFQTLLEVGSDVSLFFPDDKGRKRNFYIEKQWAWLLDEKALDIKNNKESTLKETMDHWNELLGSEGITSNGMRVYQTSAVENLIQIQKYGKI